MRDVFSSKSLLTILFCFFASFSFADSSDSLFAVSINNRWVLSHTVKTAETLFSIAGKYHVPPAVLADANNVALQSVPVAGKELYIPLGAFNHLTTAPAATQHAVPFYYKFTGNESLSDIAHNAGVMQKTIQEWNHLADNTPDEGTSLQVGWVQFSGGDKAAGASPMKATKPLKRTGDDIPDGIKVMLTDEELAAFKRNTPDSTVTEEERLYLSQTNHGMYTANDKGSCVFFEMAGKIRNGKYYAFHNLARRGTIIKIYNPGNDSVVYAKVLGPIPAGKQYYNSILGLSSGAKRKLGVNQDKLWCEISYAP